MPKERTSFYISAEVKKKLAKLAEANNRSQSNMLEELINEAANKQKKK